MAMSLRIFRVNCKLIKQPKFSCMLQANSKTNTYFRTLLSQAYNCDDAWNKHLQDSSFSKLSLNELGIQLKNQLDKSKSAAAVDINVLAHLFVDITEDEAEYMEDILEKFNETKESFPRCFSTYHAIVRGYTAQGLASRLAPLISKPLTYGIIPDIYTTNYLINYYIQQNNWKDAAQISYRSMLQDDFSNPINALLSLYACTKYLFSINIDDIKPLSKEHSEGEEDWILVKYIKTPYYDDHFDIKDERFLLGKTLMSLGKLKDHDVPSQISLSSFVIGAGLYHKFCKGISFLNEIVSSPDLKISQQALDYFSQSLDKVDSRDMDEPEVELALRTIDDVIHKLLPTHEEKSKYQSDYATVKDKLLAAGRIDNEFSLETSVEDFVSSNIQKYESPEIKLHLENLEEWRENRKKEIEAKVEEYRRNSRILELKDKIKKLQEQEELLTYFDSEEQIRGKVLEEDRENDQHLTIWK